MTSLLRNGMLTLAMSLLLTSCSKHENSRDGGDLPPPAGFEATPSLVSLSGAELKEASGIADSKGNTGFLWVEQDSGNPPDLILLGHDGHVEKSIHIEGAQNRDWEDIVLSAGPESGKYYLYVGDIGDNNLAYPSYVIYRMEEPAKSVDAVTNFDRIVFTYPDTAHDAEAFLVDPSTKDIFIITKRDEHSKIYRLPFPQSTSANNVAEFVADLPYNTVVSAALSPDNVEIIVKTYTTLNYYRRAQGKTIAETLQTEAVQLDYATEAQGEAVGFAADNAGFYTLPEEALGVVPRLSFYQRK